MRKIILGTMIAVATCAQVSAFFPDPIENEFIGQMKNGCGLFYQKTTATANGLKAQCVAIQADPKNRTLRYYTLVIDPDTMTIRPLDFLSRRLKKKLTKCKLKLKILSLILDLLLNIIMITT